MGLTAGGLTSRLKAQFPELESGGPLTTARVRYGIERCGIRPIGKAGNYHLYSEADIPRVAESIRSLGRIVRPNAENRMSGVPATAEAR